MGQVTPPKPRHQFNFQTFRYSDDSRLEVSLLEDPSFSILCQPNDDRVIMAKMAQAYWDAVMFASGATVRFDVPQRDISIDVTFSKGTTVAQFVSRLWAFYHSKPAGVEVATYTDLMDGLVTLTGLQHGRDGVLLLSLHFY